MAGGGSNALARDKEKNCCAMILYCITIIINRTKGIPIMSLSSRVHRLWCFFNKPRGPLFKVTLTRIQRRAYDLMSVASVLAFCTIMVWFLIALGLLQLSGDTTFKSTSLMRLLERWHMMPKQPFDLSTLALAWLLGFVAAIAPIVCLRRLGKALCTQPPLSFIVARRFLWLGRALVINILTGFAAAWIAASQVDEFQFSFSLGFWGTLIAAILAYVVADMIREGALAAEENREFI
ncbi:MAG: hypothetical protein ABI386_10160 [Rhodanobacter sp.]